MHYKVSVVSTKTIGSLTTANSWVIVSGDLAETSSIAIPKNEKEIIFKVSLIYVSCLNSITANFCETGIVGYVPTSLNHSN